MGVVLVSSFEFLVSSNLTNLQRRQRQRGKEGAEQPKPYYDLRFAPTGEVEMVVQGGAAEEAFATGVFEVADLQDHAHEFHHEDATDEQ